MPPKASKNTANAHPNAGRGAQGPTQAKNAKPTQAAPAGGGAVTDYDEIQRDEIEVLKSMFPEEFQSVDMGSNAWNAKTVHAYKLCLTARENQEIGITLNVKYPEPYPKVEPIIQLSDEMGLRPHHKAAIADLIKREIAANLGAEMMFQISTAVQDILEERAAARELDAQGPSLIEERELREEAERKKHEEEAARLAVEAEKERQRLAEKEKIETKRSIVQQRVAQKKGGRILDDSDSVVEFNDPDDEDGTAESRIRKFPDRIIVKDKHGRPGKFKKVGGLVFFCKSANKTLFFVRPIFEVGQDFDVTLVMKEVVFIDPDPESSRGSKAFNQALTHIGDLARSPRRNVAEVYAVADSISAEYDDDGRRHYRMDILMEYASKGSLQDLLETAGRLSLRIVRPWFLQLLDCLREMHHSTMSHQWIHPRNILLFQPHAGGKNIIKLADPFADDIRQLEYIMNGTEPEKPDEKDNWVAPERHHTKGRGRDKKSDVWDLAVLVLQMLYGLSVTEDYPSPEAVLKHPRMNPLLRDVLSKMLNRHYASRLNVIEISPLEFFRHDPDEYAQGDDYQSDTETMLTTASPMRRRRGSNSNARQGRYELEWDEIQQLGQGGFGKVVKSRNKFDGCVYAIKLIKESSRNQIDIVLREVVTLSQLNHPNVVRYFTTWMENNEGALDGSAKSEDETEEDSLSLSQNDTGELFTRERKLHRNQLDYISSKGGELWEFGYSDAGGDEPDNEEEEDDSDEDDEDEDDEDEEENVVANRKRKGKYVALRGPEIAIESDSDDAYSGTEEEEDDTNDGEEKSEEGQVEFRSTNRNATGVQPYDVSEADDSSEVFTRPAPHRQIKRTLYIQMEFCDGDTLRDMIERNGCNDPEIYWPILRQILDGLEYIHGLGIIHRDLKPENIFFAKGTSTARIGDFGLAASVNVARPKSSGGMTSAPKEGGRMESVNNLTTGVGTRMYVAPEVLLRGDYTTKVDMYSLGIIFYEMNRKPFGTGAEQQSEMSKLRSPEVIIPDAIHPVERAAEIDLIKRLLRHKPSERPDATDLLNGQSIPLRIKDDNFNSAVASLDDPVSGQTRKTIVLRKLFSKSVVPANDPFYDNKPTRGGPTVEQLVVDAAVKDRILNVFKRHGAVEVTKSFLVPFSEYYHEMDALKLMDEQGGIVQLRYDQVVPYARHIARQVLNYQKSYSFGIVFRKNPDNPHGQPTQHGEVVFDICSRSAKELDMKDAETIKVVDEIIDSFSFFQGAKMGFNINHMTIFYLILDYCGIKGNNRQPFLTELPKFWTSNTKWEQVMHAIRNHKAAVPATAYVELKRFEWREQDFDKAYKKLKNILGRHKNFNSTAVTMAFEHLRSVFDYLKRFGVKRKSYFTPLGVYSERYYEGGMVFTCSSEGVSTRQVLASGGRYDKLVKDCRPISLSEDTGGVFAVGFKLTFDSLSRGIWKYQMDAAKGATGKKKRSEGDESKGVGLKRCSVLITSPGSADVLRTHGTNIISRLWDNDIRAELKDDFSSNPHSSWMEENYEFQIIIKSSYDNTKSVKVKNLQSSLEVDQHIDELVPYLLNQIADNNNIYHKKHRGGGGGAGGGDSNAGPSSQRGRRGSNTQDMLPVGAAGGPSGTAFRGQLADIDVTLIWPEDRKGGKKPNRPHVMDNARRKVSEFLGGSTPNAPVFAIDVLKDVFEAIRVSQFQGKEGWKKALHAAGTEKGYVAEIQAQLADLPAERVRGSKARGGAKAGDPVPHFCYLYNYKTDGCCFYYLS